MSRHWTIGGPPSADDTRDDDQRPEVRPWRPGIAAPPVVRTPQFMLGGRLAAIREPSFMRRILPRVINPELETGASANRRSENRSHGK